MPLTAPVSAHFHLVAHRPVVYEFPNPFQPRYIDGFAFDTGLLVLAGLLGIAVAEVLVHATPQAGSRHATSLRCTSMPTYTPV